MINASLYSLILIPSPSCSNISMSNDAALWYAARTVSMSVGTALCCGSYSWSLISYLVCLCSMSIPSITIRSTCESCWAHHIDMMADSTSSAFLHICSPYSVSRLSGMTLFATLLFLTLQFPPQCYALWQTWRCKQQSLSLKIALISGSLCIVSQVLLWIPDSMFRNPIKV